MKRLCSIIAVLLLLQAGSKAQYTYHVIQFTDKQGTPHTIDNPTTYLSEKAIARRIRQQIAIDSTDLPVSPVYLDSLHHVPNVTVINTSRWMNQALIQTSDINALAKINSFPFVRSAQEVAPAARPGRQEDVYRKYGDVIRGSEITTPRMQANRVQQSQEMQSFDYGASLNQIHIHEGEYLHNQGYTGSGITIAVLDAGFQNYKNNPAFDSVRLQNRILGEWDFVANHASVNEDHPHGSNCFSIIAANRPGIIVGSAPHASFWLLRTENTVSEFPVEEQYWTVAAEFADSAGADMISSSLGYVDFDDPAFNHSYADRDGNTAIITRAADLAARKGMIVMNSAGNYGTLATDMRFVMCPADGDSVVAVGAVNASGHIAGLSSWGPSSNGKVKPNIVSVGQGAIFANTIGNAVAGNGTSYANPNMCGLIACLWQAFPEFTNMEIIDAVQRSAHKYNDPDERYGYGIPNFRKAYELLQAARDLSDAAPILGDAWIKAYPVPSEGAIHIIFKAPASGKAGLQLIDAAGRIIEKKELEIQADNIYTHSFTRSTGLPKGVYYIRYQDGSRWHTLPVIRR